MPGAGKSSVGVILAKVLGYEFIDTDLVIQHREKRLLREIIADEGNEGFLAIENEVNATLEGETSRKPEGTRRRAERGPDAEGSLR